MGMKINKVEVRNLQIEDYIQLSQSFNMLKGIMVQLPEIMNKTTTFELGLELIK